MKNILQRIVLLIILSVGAAINLAAQGLNIPIPYNWRPRNPVPERLIDDPRIGHAGMAQKDAAGNAFISYNIPRLNQPPEVLVFLRVHEYGHIVKGHLDNRNFANQALNEAEADCYAGQELYASDPNIINRVIQIFESMGNTGGDMTHGTGIQMAGVIKACIQNTRFQQPAAIPTLPADSSSGIGGLQPLSITDNLKTDYSCDVKTEDFNYSRARYIDFERDVKVELRDLKDRGEQLVEILKDDTYYQRAIEAEESANEKLESANEYFIQRGFRSEARDRLVLEKRRDARRAAIDARREYREKAKICEEATVKKKAIQYLIAELEEKIRQRCNINGVSINFVGTTWKHSQTEASGIKTYTLKFLPNGELVFAEYRPGIDATIDRAGTWVCTDSSVKINGRRFFVGDDREYELKLDNNVLYISSSANAEERVYVFVRQ